MKEKRASEPASPKPSWSRADSLTKPCSIARTCTADGACDSRRVPGGLRPARPSRACQPHRPRKFLSLSVSFCISLSLSLSLLSVSVSIYVSLSLSLSPSLPLSLALTFQTVGHRKRARAQQCPPGSESLQALNNNNNTYNNNNNSSSNNNNNTLQATIPYRL